MAAPQAALSHAALQQHWGEEVARAAASPPAVGDGEEPVPSAAAGQGGSTAASQQHRGLCQGMQVLLLLSFCAGLRLEGSGKIFS